MAKLSLYKIVIVVLCLSAASELVSGENGDLGVLAGVQQTEYRQEPNQSGEKSIHEAEFSPAQQLLPSPQPNPQPRTALTLEDEDVSIVDSRNSNNDVQIHSSDRREGSQQSLTDDATVSNFMQSKTQISDLETKAASSSQSLKSEEKIIKNTVDNSSVMLHSVLQDSQKTNYVDQHEKDDTDTGRSFGNPPVVMNSDELVSTEKVSSDLSPEEREKIPTETADNLGISALDPGIALRALNQNFRTLISQATSTPSTYPSDSTESHLSKFSSSTSYFKTEKSRILNIINNIVGTDSKTEPQTMNDNRGSNSTDMNLSKTTENLNRQNYGRKVLNEENVESTDKIDDEYDLNVDSYFSKYYDENEGNYAGGEVLGTISPEDEAEWLTVNQTANEAQENLGVTLNEVASSDELQENLQPHSDRANDPEWLNFEQISSYEEDDDDWYYDPGEMTKVKDGPEDNNPSQGIGDATNGNPSELKNKVEAPELKEMTAKDDLHKKKVLQAPKGTIILYTILVVILIACIVIFSVWKRPLENGRLAHQSTLVRAGEEGKRLLDHPFV